MKNCFSHLTTDDLDVDTCVDIISAILWRATKDHARLFLESEQCLKYITLLPDRKLAEMFGTEERLLPSPEELQQILIRKGSH